MRLGQLTRYEMQRWIYSAPLSVGCKSGQHDAACKTECSLISPFANTAVFDRRRLSIASTSTRASASLSDSQPDVVSLDAKDLSTLRNRSIALGVTSPSADHAQTCQQSATALRQFLSS